ncbi:MAG: hypothetical protein ACRDPJ_14160 [Nocardioidaceae bacterium]
MLHATDSLVAELAGRGTGLDITTSAEGIGRWGEVWSSLDGPASDVLPCWLLERAGELRERYEGLLSVAVGDSVVQGDIRNDNLIVRDDGSVVFVDWGMSRRGPRGSTVFDDLVRRSPGLRRLGDDHVTGFLVALGAWLGYRTTVAVDIGLPTLNEFRRRESARMLEGARRRLGL